MSETEARDAEIESLTGLLAASMEREARLRGVVEAVQALAGRLAAKEQEYLASITNTTPVEVAATIAGEAHGYRLAARDIRAALAVSSSGEAESGEARDGCWCYSCDAAAPGFMFRQRMNLCPDCGNKRCPRATWHGHRCTGSNEAGQPGSIYVAAPAPVLSGGQADREALQRLLALSAAATPGPWSVYDRGVGFHIALDAGVGDRILPEGFRTDLGRREDAEFIAAAANYVRDHLAAARPVLSREALREQAARALVSVGRVRQDGLTPEEQVDRVWADDQFREAALAKVDAVLDVLDGGRS